jgi:hypothetical protein
MGVEEIRAVKKVEGGYLLYIGANPENLPAFSVAIIAKVDEEGELLWHHIQDNGLVVEPPPNGSSNQSCHVHSDGTYFFMGITRDEVSGQDFDFWILRTDAEGNTLWSRAYGGPNDDRSLGITALNDSTILAYGNYGVLTGSEDDEFLWLMALDLDGELRWERFYKDDGYPTVSFKDLSVLDNGDIVMLYLDCDGISDCGASTQKRLRMAYLDAEGNRLWASTLREYRRIGHSAELLLPLDNGQFLVASHREIDAWPPPTLYWISPAGEVVQQYDFPFEDVQYILDVFLSSSGDIIGCGFSDGYIDGEFYGGMGWVFSMTQDGQMNWERLVYDDRPPTAFHGIYAGVETADGGFLFGGIAADTVRGVGTNWLLKLDGDGCYEPDCGDIQFVDVRYIAGPNADLPAIYRAYPNPVRAGGRLYVEAIHELPLRAAQRAVFFDAYGRQLSAHRLPLGPVAELPVGDWPPGLYFLRLETAWGEVVQVVRVVVL